MSTQPTPVASSPAPFRARIQLSHVNLYCYDLDAQVDFYTRVLGLRQTDRGIMRGNIDIAFLSGEPRDHHQLALAGGRPKESTPGPLGHVAFRLDSLATLRTVRWRLLAEGIDKQHPITHGNAWSLYFQDPESNRVETFVDTPWHVQQPVGEPWDVTLDDATLVDWTRKRFANRPDTCPMADWQATWNNDDPPGRPST